MDADLRESPLRAMKVRSIPRPASAMAVVSVSGTNAWPRPPASTTAGMFRRGASGRSLLLEPEVLDLVPPGQAVSIERDVFPQLAEDGTLLATELPGLLIDMGTPEGYLDAHAELLAARPVSGVHPDARVAADAELIPPVRIDAGAEVGEGTRIGPLVSVGRNAIVRSGAKIRLSAVLPCAVVPADARIADAIVTPDAVLDGSIASGGD
jgi:mannose-1-phosphate guanylyltransferase